jgi:hypothetical protein
MLLHCSHNLDLDVLLDASFGIRWYEVDATFTTDNVIEIDHYPREVGRWKYKNVYYELNKKNNWMRWYENGERFSYTWSNRLNKGSEMNESEKIIAEQVENYMNAVGVEDWGFRFLKLKPTDKMIWHIDSPNHAPSAINISLKDKSPIVFDEGEYSYDCALIDVCNNWHTVKTGSTERLTFKIIPKEPYDIMSKKLDAAGFLQTK